MERRNFLRAMLGVAAATALPSEIFPFRKIFLPSAPRIVTPKLAMPEYDKFYSNEITREQMRIMDEIPQYMTAIYPEIATLGISHNPYPGRLNDFSFTVTKVNRRARTIEVTPNVQKSFN